VLGLVLQLEKLHLRLGKLFALAAFQLVKPYKKARQLQRGLPTWVFGLRAGQLQAVLLLR
jgi:hypothetical protein